MRFIKNIIRQVMVIVNNKKGLVLGRWNIEQCEKKINIKIDLSNRDHCGPCGQYTFDRQTKDKNN